MQFETPGGLMQIDLLSEGKVAVATGHEDLQGKTKEALVLGQKGKDVNFVDVLSFPDRQKWKQIAELKNLPEGVLGVRLVAEDDSEKWVVSSEAGEPFELHGQRVVGRMALLEKTASGPLKLIDQVE